MLAADFKILTVLIADHAGAVIMNTALATAVQLAELCLYILHTVKMEHAVALH